MTGPNYVVPSRKNSLGYLWMAWIEAHCVIPDGENRGDAFSPVLDHRVWLTNWGEIKPTAKLGDLNVAFTHRTGIRVGAQKIGKSPGVAAETCLDFVGPAVFAGRARSGDVYECSTHGCRCGWHYEYVPGEPMGRHWATPRIQLCALVEEQVNNTWDVLLPMINDGPLADVIGKTNWNFIRHPNRNEDSVIERVTSQADSKLGARIIAAKCDETGLWTASNGMKRFITTLRRGAAAVGGRVSETTNAWDPAENSVAQETFASKRPDILKHYFPPPPKLNFHLKRDRAKIIAWNYASAPWVDQRAIEAESLAMLEKDPATAERFFGDRVVAGTGTWLDDKKWSKRAAPITVKPRTKVAAGFDGSDNDDTTGIRLETLDGYQFTPTYGDQKLKTFWRPQDWNGRIPRAEVMTAWQSLNNDFDIVRAYCDPFMWETEIDTLANKFGEKKFLKWATNRLAPMYSALERFRTDVYNLDSSFSHDGDEDMLEHVRNAVVRNRSMDASTGNRRYFIGKPTDIQKIDLVMASVLAHEAATNAIADGENVVAETLVYY